MSFFAELKRRNVFRMGIAYVVVAWVMLQAIDFTLDIIAAPNWVMQVFVMAGIAGLPVVLIIAWIFELTPDGIKLESEIDRSQSVAKNTGHKMDRTIIVFLALAVLLLLGDRFVMREDIPVATATPEVTMEQASSSGQEALSSRRSVAVLPFVNMSSDPEQEYFSDGLSEELLNRLAKNDQLHVAEATRDADPGYVSSWWAMLYYHQNDRERLRKILIERQELAKSSNNLVFTTVTAFYAAWLDGVEAAIPILQESYNNKEQLLVWPEYFYLPEHVSNDPAWIAFWQQPGLAELIEARREFGPYEKIGFWKARSVQ